MMKKQLIMEKALELFSEQGFESTSVQQITERCGISKGAFYLSFKTKEELIFSMIDHFLQQFIVDIDQSVKEALHKEDMFVEFYKGIFKTFQKHSKSARMFLNENTNPANKELLEKVKAYEVDMTKSIAFMLEGLYGETLQHTKYDLVYCIKGFMKSYAEFFIFADLRLDLDQLAKSLAEKTEIIARHSTISFITEELNQYMNYHHEEMVSQDKVLELLELSIQSVEEAIVLESLQLLKGQVAHQTYSKVIIIGLIENIRLQPECKWQARLLMKYFQF
ncbi:MAG: TetR/AcrR family transcriptional regulator [Lysinibacillus sp.]